MIVLGQFATVKINREIYRHWRIDKKLKFNGQDFLWLAS